MKKILVLFILSTICFAQTPCLDAVANATGVSGEFVPQCEEDGSYSPLQCWGSTGYCWCVDEDGVEIPGTSLGPGEGVPNCNNEINVLEYDNEKTIIYSFDLFGREVNQKTGFEVHLYLDGTVKKEYCIY